MQLYSYKHLSCQEIASSLSLGRAVMPFGCKKPQGPGEQFSRGGEGKFCKTLLRSQLIVTPLISVESHPFYSNANESRIRISWCCAQYSVLYRIIMQYESWHYADTEDAIRRQAHSPCIIVFSSISVRTGHEFNAVRTVPTNCTSWPLAVSWLL